MSGLATIVGLAGASATVAVILVESVLLHVGYGRLCRMAVKSACRTLED